MTDSYEWDDENVQDDNTSGAPKALRTAYEKQKAENAAMAKQLRELANEVRTTKLEKKLSAKGLPEKAVDLFPKDVDPTDEAVTQWVENYGGLFGAQSTQTTTTSPTEETKPADKQPEENYILASQFEQMNQVTQTAPPAGPKNDLQTMLQNPNLVEEVPFADFLAAMRAQGAKV